MQKIGYSPEDVHAEYLNGTLTPHEDASECLKPYDIDFNTKRSTLLLEVPADHINGSSIVGNFDRKMDFPFKLGDNSYGGNLNNLTYPGWSFRAPGNNTWLHLGDFFADHWTDIYRGFWPDIAADLEILYSNIIRTNPGEDQLRDILENSVTTWAKQVDFQSNGPGKRNTLGRGMYVNGEYLQPDQLTISKCFSKELEEQCQFYFSLPISLTVIGCNIAKVICMYLTARCHRKSILLTLGDGLASFLNKPDATTKGRCFMSKSDMTTGQRPWCRGSSIPDTLDTTTPVGEMGNPQLRQLRRHPQHLPRRSRWLRSPGWKPWTLTLILWVTARQIRNC